MKKLNIYVCDNQSCRRTCTEPIIRIGKKQELHYCSINCLVYSYPTKHKEGFVDNETKELLKLFPDIKTDKFSSALTGITCMRDEKTKEFIIYHCDISHAIQCGLENRELTLTEWD
jgi:hypothetical protein